MSDHTQEETKLDVNTLREAIKEEYAEVAANPTAVSIKFDPYAIMVG